MQGFKDGFQQELPDIWLTNGNPWELRRPGICYPVCFYGEVKDGKWVPGEKVGASQIAALSVPSDQPGRSNCAWRCWCCRNGILHASGVLQVYAQAYDNPIPGFETKTVGNLRLFEALPETELNMEDFNNGDFAKVGKRIECRCHAMHVGKHGVPLCTS